MLNIQTYLRSGKTLDDLTNDHGIIVGKHETEPLVVLNYSQFDSPKLNDVVRECRGLVLEKDTWNTVAVAFPRFFNWGEVMDEADDFNWNNFYVNSKEDGSLMLVYYYNGEWRLNSRGSFGNAECNGCGKTWRELAWDLVDDKTPLMDKGCTYVFEFCSVFNKVVRNYDDRKLFL